MATILVVDDQSDKRAYLARLLNHAGRQMLEAIDGEEALHIAQAEQPPKRPRLTSRTSRCPLWRPTVFN